MSWRRVLVALPVLGLIAAGPPPAGLPRPVNGISFDEWASANARLAAGRSLDEVLGILQVDKAKWEEANTSFVAALKSGDPGGPMFARYGTDFNNPSAGRFGEAGNAPKTKQIETFEQYARIQAEMSAAQEVGKDPVMVLQQQFGMTPYDYAQEGGVWVKKMGELAASDPDQLRAWQHVQAAALAEARKRYATDGPKTRSN